MPFSLFLESAAAYNAEFRKLAERLNAVDAGAFTGDAPFSWILRAARNDMDLAIDMATYLLYGKDGVSPLEKGYDNSRPLGARINHQLKNLPSYFAIASRGTQSKRYAGNFTDAGLNSGESEFDPAERPVRSVDDDAYKKLVGLFQSATGNGMSDQWIASRLGVDRRRIPAIRKQLADVGRKRALTGKAAFKTRSKVDLSRVADTIERLVGNSPDGVKLDRLAGAVFLPVDELRVIARNLGYTVAPKRDTAVAVGRMGTDWVFPKGTPPPPDPRAELDQKVAALSAAGDSHRKIASKLNLSQSWVKNSLARTAGK